MDDVATRGGRSRADDALDAAAIALDRVALVRSGRVVLADVSVTIAPGEFIGVFGPNGAGKSTLLHAILGLLRPAAGSIRVFGAPPERASRGAGYLPQHHSPVADLRLRGRDFVAAACHGARWGLPLLGAAGRRIVDNAIAAVEAEALAARPLSELSGGELQRLLLAQALLGDPRLLLLDEPLVSLDPRFQNTVVALVKRLQRDKGMTVLFTAHDINPLLGAMDRVLFLGQGNAALGTVDAVVRGDVLSRLYGTPIEVFRVKDRILVVSEFGLGDGDAHRHDA
jgi:zinc/manganese transport system ATP-binding protein